MPWLELLEEDLCKFLGPSGVFGMVHVVSRVGIYKMFNFTRPLPLSGENIDRCIYNACARFSYRYNFSFHISLNCTMPSKHS